MKTETLLLLLALLAFFSGCMSPAGVYDELDIDARLGYALKLDDVGYIAKHLQDIPPDSYYLHQHSPHPLIFDAAFFEATRVVEFLLGKGANKEQRNCYGQTPLMWARKEPERTTNKKIVTLLRRDSLDEQEDTLDMLITILRFPLGASLEATTQKHRLLVSGLPPSVSLHKLEHALIQKGYPIAILNDSDAPRLEICLERQGKNIYGISMYINKDIPLSGSSWFGVLEKYHGFWIYTPTCMRHH